MHAFANGLERRSAPTSTAVACTEIAIGADDVRPARHHAFRGVALVRSRRLWTKALSPMRWTRPRRSSGESARAGPRHRRPGSRRSAIEGGAAGASFVPRCIKAPLRRKTPRVPGVSLRPGRAVADGQPRSTTVGSFRGEPRTSAAPKAGRCRPLRSRCARKLIGPSRWTATWRSCTPPLEREAARAVRRLQPRRALAGWVP